MDGWIALLFPLVASPQRDGLLDGLLDAFEGGPTYEEPLAELQGLALASRAPRRVLNAVQVLYVRDADDAPDHFGSGKAHGILEDLPHEGLLADAGGPGPVGDLCAEEEIRVGRTAPIPLLVVPEAQELVLKLVPRVPDALEEPLAVVFPLALASLVPFRGE
eukprot:CAMPEP_0197488022 /NCGR_PEP_ID=MMETSP1311-20131121/3048_1 /TAXON_ID=464262 /ORGANISM="Genus nov. species nov., Strain RCC856" /LENGTH=161 /DNA_ID=CAMNT_0043031933 /DNA_START=67 /DNA_END=549 /DNA_ORIENTATION=-